LLSTTYQTLPWILIQEPHSHVKRRATPAFKRVRIGECPTRLLGDIGYVDRAQTGGEQRLVRIAPCSVHNECAGVLADGLGESFWSFLDDDVPPTIFTGERSVKGGPIRILSVPKLGDDDLILEAGFTLYKVMRRRVVTAIREKKVTVWPLMELPLTAISPRYARSFWARFCVCTSLNNSGVSSMNYDEFQRRESRLPTTSAHGCPRLPGNEDIMGQQTEEEWNVCLWANFEKGT
jgi:hypothetical protein